MVDAEHPGFPHLRRDQPVQRPRAGEVGPNGFSTTTRGSAVGLAQQEAVGQPGQHRAKKRAAVAR